MPDLLDMHYKMVVKAITDGRVIPFLGAGVNLCGRPPEMEWQHSQCEHLPSIGELTTHLAENFRYPSSKTQVSCPTCQSEISLAEKAQDLARVSQYVAVMTGIGPLYEELHSLFDADYLSTPIHQFFATLPAVLRDRGYPRTVSVQAVGVTSERGVSEQVGVHSPDAYSPYETGLRHLLSRMERDHPRFSEALVYHQRLTENITRSRRYRDTDTRKAERSEIIDRLNELALSALGISFSELCDLITPAAGQERTERLPEQKQPIKLAQILATRFDIGELRTLCFHLGVDYDDLPAEGKANKARELVTYLERRGRIPELIETGKQLRPDVPWPERLPRTEDSLRRQLLIVTTNYDDLLERAFQAAGEPFHLVSYVTEGEQRGKFLHRPPDGEARPIEKPNQYRGLLLDQCPVILKIHGAVDRVNAERDSFVITEDHYIDYLTRTDIASLIPVPLPAKLKRSHLLFLGHSLRDWNLRVILHRIWGEQKLTWKSWAIQLHPDPIDEQFWRKRDVDILSVCLEDYVAALSERVQALTRAGGAL